MFTQKNVIMPRSRFSWATGILAVALTLLQPAQAQPVPKLSAATITTGFPAGGSSDIVARLLAEHLRGKYADNVLVENKPGAGGRLALAQVRDGATDGSNILLSPSGMFVLFPHIYTDLRYDALEDFAPITRLAKFPFLLVISDRVPPEVTTLDQFIAWAKENPEQSSFGSPGAGTSAHFSGIQLGQLANFPYTHAAYRGMAPLVTDLLGGHIASGVLTPADVLPVLSTGKLRLLATTGDQRSPFTPDVPTYTELGYPDILIEESYSLYGPAGLSPERREQLATQAHAMLERPDIQRRFAEMGLEAAGTSPDELTTLITHLHERWGGIVKASGFTPSQ